MEVIQYGVDHRECEECEHSNYGTVTGDPQANVFAWECPNCGHVQEP